MEKVKNFKFVFEGQDCKVKLMYRGKTTIALIVIGKEDMSGHDRCERIYCGASSCDPRDVYDVHAGIKLACRSALGISEENRHVHGIRSDKDIRRAAIYRQARMALNVLQHKQLPAPTVESVFGKLPANLTPLEKAEHHI